MSAGHVKEPTPASVMPTRHRDAVSLSSVAIRRNPVSGWSPSTRRFACCPARRDLLARRWRRPGDMCQRAPIQQDRHVAKLEVLVTPHHNSDRQPLDGFTSLVPCACVHDRYPGGRQSFRPVSIRRSCRWMQDRTEPHGGERKRRGKGRPPAVGTRKRGERGKT